MPCTPDQKPEPQHTGCGYERSLREPDRLRPIIKRIVDFLETRLNDFDGIAISGYSMSLLGPIIAYQLNKPVCVVEKGDERRNTSCKVEGIHSLRWLMIDDLVATGRTLSRVAEGVKKIDGKLVGLITWYQVWTADFTEYIADDGFSHRVPRWLSFDESLS